LNIHARITGRILVLSILVLALVDPRLPWRDAPVDAVVLVDESFRLDGLLGSSQWQALRDELKRLPDESRFAVLRFGAVSVLETAYQPVADLPQSVPRTLPLDRSASNIEDAVLSGLRLLEPGRPAAMILLSDGRETTGDATAALRLAADASVRVFDAAHAFSSAFEDEVRILDLDLPARVRLGQRLPVGVTLAGPRKQTVRLSLLLDAGLEVEEQVLIGDGGRRHVAYWLDPAVTGVGRVELVVDFDERSAPLRRVAMVEVEPPPGVLHVGTAGGMPSAALSLIAGGWPLRYAGPQALAQALDDDPHVIILDDLAVGDVPDAVWNSLERQVREHGTGLIVLGGPRSFGRGGYRHSQLETLLPVIAEAVRPQPPATVLFVVDKSGSMDRSEAGVSRFAFARQAVIETARQLSPDDTTGLLAFDAEPHWVVELARHPDPVTAIESGWKMQPGGGTRLHEALREAVASLEHAGDEMRLLVLVTDGLVGEGGFEDLAPLFAQTGTRLIAIVVDGGEELGVLDSLAATHGGSVVSVGDVMQLPRLMPALVGEQRAMTETAEQVEVVEPLPFAFPGPWPRVDAYAVTRARPHASVFLRSEHGDPLLAGWPVGAGWVLALPGGLGGWAPAWQRWAQGGVLLGGLVEWASARHASPWLELRAEHLPGRLRLDLEAVTGKREWLLDGRAEFVVRDPAGRVIELEGQAEGPGRYVAETPVSQAGLYRVAAQLGSHTTWRDSYRVPMTDADAIYRREDWIDQGLLLPWPEGGLAASTRTRSELPTRAALAAFGVLAYLALIFRERGLWGVLGGGSQSSSGAWRASLWSRVMARGLRR
jgi:Mg-chelatase subunit ChlD